MDGEKAIGPPLVGNLSSDKAKKSTTAGPAPLPAPDFERLLGLVRDIRAEAQNIQRLLSEIKKKGELTDKKVRDQELKAAIDESSKIFDYNTEQIKNRLHDLRELINENSQLYDWAGDEITHIENLWERISLSWPKLPEKITYTDQLLSELVFHAGLLTIPSRVNQHLDAVRIGQPFDFHKAFEDELPQSDDRLKVLHHIHGHPASIQGVVEVEGGLIYKASKKLWRRCVSYALIALLMVAGAALAYKMPNALAVMDSEELLDSLTEKELDSVTEEVYSSVPKEKLDSLTEKEQEELDALIEKNLLDRIQKKLLLGYLFLMLGGIIHIGIDALKQARAGKGKTFLALEDWSLWIHVKELSIITTIFSLWVGFLGLAFYLKTVEWYTAFLVGYSIDSFVDLFLQRFTAKISESTETLKKQLE